MAGGQERVLRRRIKSVQSTKKITRAMELIAASRIVKAQQRVAAARPYSEQITEVIRNLAKAGAGGAPRCSRPARRSARSASWSSPPTAAWPAATTRRSSAWPSGRCWPSGPRAARPRWSRSARRPTATSASAGYEIAESFSGFTDEPTYEDARGVAAFVTERFEQGDYDQVRIAYTRFLSLGTQRATDATFLPLERLAEDERDRRRRARPPTTSSSPTPTRSSSGCCPATPRPASSPRCSTPPRPSTPAASGP